MALDLEKLTLGEVAKIEELSGQSIDAIASENAPKGKSLAALALIAKRRSGDPNFSWNKALDLSFDEANEILGLDDEQDVADEVDPTTPEPEADTPPSTSGSKPRKTAKPAPPKE